MKETTHSDEMAILFVDWIFDNSATRNSKHNVWQLPGGKKTWYTTRKLYQEFIVSYYANLLTKKQP